MGSGVLCPELGGGPLVAVVSWNQVGRTDLTPVKLPESVLLTLSRRKLWYIGGIGHCHMEILILEVRCDASDLSINDSDV